MHPDSSPQDLTIPLPLALRKESKGRLAPRASPALIESLCSRGADEAIDRVLLPRLLREWGQASTPIDPGRHERPTPDQKIWQDSETRRRSARPECIEGHRRSNGQSRKLTYRARVSGNRDDDKHEHG